MNIKKIKLTNVIIKRIKIIVSVCIFIIIISVLIFKAYSVENEKKISESISAKEKTVNDLANKEVDSTHIFVDLNSLLTFKEGSTRTYLNLTNPKYSAYYMQVKIGLSENDILYESEILPPDTTVYYIDINRVLEKGQYKATAYYIIYDSEGINLIGNYEVAITIAVV